MSEFKRFQRLAKSIIPRFKRGDDEYYSREDARNMINDLGMQMEPEVLAKLIENEEVLEDFTNSIYQLEKKVRKKVVTDFATIDLEFEPKVYVEDGVVGFTIVHRGDEIVFAEYKI
ncbi:MAG: hypothetical protein KDD99_29295 [Bacteroidetes bacterium]|nr:hypothetical protein [Bacteroidota bacterium]